MPPVTVDLVEGRAGDDPALDLALAPALLARVASGGRAPLVRVYRPWPTVAFGRRDSFLPGFAPAAAAATDHGFSPAIRAAGGRAAAYHNECLVIEEMIAEHDAASGIQKRFAAEAERQARALRGLGIDARVGEVPGEYCPGAFSVNARGRTKLVGAAQRTIRGAWLFSSVVVVGGSAPLRAVLEDVYAALALDWNPASTGSIEDESPGVTVGEARKALMAALAARYRLVPAQLTPDDLAAGRDLLSRHRVATA
ncbi:MAG: lipoyl protein ligase domain-containing protein [Solirubrobacteraceae bacterium]